MSSAAPRLLQSRSFWIFLLALSLLAAFAAARLQSIVDPGVDLDISFSRQQAVESAQQFRQQQFPELETARTAASFLTESAFANYVQLEAGGVEAYQQFMKQADSVTHLWRVRLFTPAQERELQVDYAPWGERVGFQYIVPQNEPGAALTDTTARALAEAGAREFLGERFTAYKPLETRVTPQESGRVDHVFTYEHQSLSAGEARFRYRLSVTGDKLTGIVAIKFIPQAFNQRFGEIRTLNTQISQVANYVMMGVLVLGGLVGGGFWLYRHEQLHLRPALPLAALVAAGLAGATLANLPMSWMNYQTAQSAGSFLTQQVAGAAMTLLLATLVLAGIYGVAENLTRQAFPAQPRLWGTLNRVPVASPEMAGRILGGYAWTGFFLLYAVLFGILRKDVLGWWEPTGIDFNPNILASSRPALGPIFNALQAGTWEECIFRAVPLSIAVMVGERYGIRKPLLAVMLVVQALVFAAAHASYPNLPGYSRVVELMLPALVFGVVYLRFGLLIAMLTHFEYDLVVMSTPIFLAESSSLWIDRVLVLLAGFAPLMALAYGYWKQGALQALAAEWFNGTATTPATAARQQAPLATPTPLPPEPHSAAAPGYTPLLPARWLQPMAAVGLLALAVPFMQPLSLQFPQQQISQAEAKALAARYLTEHGVALEGDWRQSAVLVDEGRGALDFVWETGGIEDAQRLLGTYISIPGWSVSWRNFDGPVEDRTEVWQVKLLPDGQLRELVHTLPEGRAGATLTADEAHRIAKAWITTQGLADVAILEDNVVQQNKRPARMDWLLIYLDKASFSRSEGNAALLIRIAGDEVVGYSRSILIPQAWARERNEQQSQRRIFQAATMVALLGLLGCAASTLFGRQRRSFSVRSNWPWMLLTLSTAVIALMRIDNRIVAFVSTLPWDTQMLTLWGTLSVQAIISLLVVFLLAHTIHGERPQAGADRKSDFLQGLVVAICYVGLQALLLKLVPSTQAPYANLGPAGSSVPVLVAALAGISTVLPWLVTLVALLGISRFNVTRGRQSVLVVLALVFAIGTALGTTTRHWTAGLPVQLLLLAEMYLIYLFIRRGQPGAAIVCVGAESAFEQLANLRAVYPGSAWHALLGLVVTLAATWWLLQHWYKYAGAVAPVTDTTSTSANGLPDATALPQ